MRVLLVTDALPQPARGGLDHHVRELRAALDGRDVQVELALGSQRLFSSDLDAFRPDVVHIHSLQGLSHQIPQQARQAGCRVVWTLHDFHALCSRTHLHRKDGAPCGGPDGGRACGPCWGGLRRLVGRPLFSRRTRSFAQALGSAHVLVAPSVFVADEMTRHGVDDQRLVVLPPGTPKRSKETLEGSKGPVKQFMYLGDLRWAKGPDLAVEAFASLTGGRAALTLHGGPPPAPAPPEQAYRKRLVERSAQVGVELAGPYRSRDLSQMLSEACAVVVPSRVRETFGRTTNEALQLGVPVVVTDAGALPEQVQSGINGIVVPSTDVDGLAQAMLRMMECSDMMRTQRSQWPEAPSLETHVDGLMPLYEGKA